MDCTNRRPSPTPYETPRLEPARALRGGAGREKGGPSDSWNFMCSACSAVE